MNTRKIQIYFFRILMILALALSLAGYTPGVSARVTQKTGVIEPVELQQAPAYPIRDAGTGFSYAEHNYPVRAEASVQSGPAASNPVSTIQLENRHSSMVLAAFDEPQAELAELLDVSGAAVVDVAADSIGPNIMLASGASSAARRASPFVGSWQAVDLDGSDMTLTIAGPPNGPFQITSTDNYISFCGGEAGLLRGTGVLNESDPNLLEADLHLECFTTGDTLDFHLTLRYSAFTNTLGSRYEGFNAFTIWHRPGQELPPAPEIGLRLNYGHDWVESFYEAEHMVWLTVTESDGVTVKAIAELVTEPKDFWGGETGFQTNPEDWDPAPPDIQPYDWVYAWVDNGAFAQVQVGDINGTIDVANDSITGTVYAPWFPDNVEVEIDCHPWGAGMENEIIKSDWVLPNGVDTYTCSWAGEWEIQPGQDVGVGYLGPDEHWAANAFAVPWLRAHPEWESVDGWLWAQDRPLHLEIDDPGTPEQPDLSMDMPGEVDPNLGSVWFDFAGQYDLKLYDVVTLTNGIYTRSLIVSTVTITSIDVDNDIVMGTAEAGASIRLPVPGEVMVTTGGDGIWTAKFFEHGLDVQPGTTMIAEEYDEDGDLTSFEVYIPNPRMNIFPDWEWFDGLDWPDGATVAISVTRDGAEKTECGMSVPDVSGGFFNGGFPEGCDIVPGDSISMTDGVTFRTHIVRTLVITDANEAEDTVSGIADSFETVDVWPHETGEQLHEIAGADGSWLVDFSGVFDLLPGVAGMAQILDGEGNATLADWFVLNPRLMVQITEDWFTAQQFPPSVELSFDIYGLEGGDPLITGSMWTDPSGNAGIWVGDQEGGDLQPGYLITVSDGTNIRSIVLESLVFDVFDLTNGHLEGTAPEPYGRTVWVGIGWENEGWSMEVTTDGSGNWSAEYGGPVPADYQWAAAQVFDADGDVSEVRPALVIEP